MYYYKFNISDWHLATSHLTLEEESIYFKLINYYYDTETPIPLETQSVIRRLRLGSYSDIVNLILEEFFVKQEDGWHHERCDIEIKEYHLKADKNKNNGKLGGRPKKINELANNPKETQMVSENNPNITLTNNHKPITINKQKTNKTTIPDDFGISERVRLWAAKKNISSLETHLENFILTAKKQGYKYADWDSAFMVAISANWANVQKKAWQ